MQNLLEAISPFNVGSDVDPGTMPGGTAIPFHVDRFGTGHIEPPTHAVGGYSYQLPRPNTSVLVHGNGPRYVNIGSTTYIPYYAPYSTAHVP